VAAFVVLAGTGLRRLGLGGARLGLGAVRRCDVALERLDPAVPAVFRTRCATSVSSSWPMTRMFRP